MKRINRENKFTIIWLMCVCLLIGACNLGFFKETWSAFGDVTGQLTVPYTINYFSNYPEELNLNDDDKKINFKGNTYTIMVNEFTLSGYEFVSWNTLKDGTGDVYNPNEVIEIDQNLTFYAQWKKVEVIKISYGDINLDALVDNNDYLLIEQYVTLGTGVEEQGLSNADVNVDGKIDLVDVDIIKQVCIGTEGYVGILPNNPILIYEVYKNNTSGDVEGEPDINDGNLSGDEENKDDEDSTLDNGEQSGDQSQDGNSSSDENGDSSSSGGNDSSSSNSSSSSDSGGNDSSSSDSGGKPSGGSSNNPGTSSGNKPSSGSSSKPSNDNSSSNSGNDQGDASSNEIEGDDSLNSSTDNSEDNIVSGEQSDNDVNKEEIKEPQITSKPNNIYVTIIVLGICLLAIRLIIYVINKFRQKEKNI